MKNSKKMSDKMSQDYSGSYYRPLFIITVIFISSLFLPIHILASKEIKLDSSLNMLKLIRNGHEVKLETRRHYSERVKRSGSMDTGLNVAEENTILAVHDDVRIVLGSSNMMMMVSLSFYVKLKSRYHGGLYVSYICMLSSEGLLFEK